MNKEITLGIDPGNEGGASLLLGIDTIMAWWAWHPFDKRKGEIEPEGSKQSIGRYRLNSSTEQKDREVSSLYAVATAMVFECSLLFEIERCVVVVEGLFAPKDNERSNPQTILFLAEAAGEMLGPLRSFVDEQHPLYRPRSSVWRPAVFSGHTRSHMDKGAWERLAIERAAVSFHGTSERPNLLSEIPTGAREHVCEALWMARYGRMEELQVKLF
jgi:hypothetical protein